jgi:hypothetical protein
MSEEKPKLKYTTMTYVGKEWKKTFDNDDGSKTKSYKVNFKVNPDSDGYPVSFWAYDNTKGFESLEEGEKYSIGFVEKENPKGDKPIKNAKWFGEPSKDSTSNSPSTNTKDFDAFLKQYMANEGEMVVSKAALSYFANKYEDEYVAIAKYLSDSFTSGDKEAIPEEEIVVEEQ